MKDTDGADLHDASPCLVIARTSTHDREDYLDMARQTVRTYADRPGASWVLERVEEILEDPDRYGEVIREGSMVAVRLYREGTVFLFCRGTAAIEDLDETNAFVEVVKRTVQELEPAEVCLQGMSRLCRNADFAGKLAQAFTKAGTSVFLGGVPIDLRAQWGRQQFYSLALMGEMERVEIHRRTREGALGKFDQGMWPRAEWQLPYPWRRGQDKRIEVDEELADRLRLLIPHMAREIAPSELVAIMAELGIPPRCPDRLRSGSSVLDHTSPHQVVRSLEAQVSVWRTSEYEYIETSKNMPDLPGRDAIILEDGSTAYSVHMKFPPPAEPLASEEVFDAIERRIASRPVLPGRGARGGGVVLYPLSGWEWDDGEFQYRLVPEHKAYKVRRRPLVDAFTDDGGKRVRRGWRQHGPSGREGTLMAVIDARQLHECLAREIAVALGKEVPAKVIESMRCGDEWSQVAPVQVDTTAAVRRHIRDLKKRARRFRELAADEGDHDAAQEYMRDARRCQRDIRTEERKLEELERDRDARRRRDTFETSGGIVVRALAVLHECGARCEASGVQRALEDILVRPRMEFTPLEVRWSVTVRLAAGDVGLEIGPVCGSVPNRLRNAANGRGLGSRRGPLCRELVERFMTGESVDDLLRLLGLSQATRVRREIAAGLEAQFDVPKRAGEAITNGMTPEIRRHLWSALTEDISPGTADPSYVAHLGRVYRDPAFTWHVGQERRSWEPRQKLLDLVAAAGGDLSDRDLQEQLLAQGMSAHTLQVVGRDGRRYRACVDVGPPCGTKGERAVGLAVCPHCGERVAHAIITPETDPWATICGSCRRTSDPRSPVYPEWYLDPFAPDGEGG